MLNIDMQAVMKLPPAQRARAVAIILSSYADQTGRLAETPMNLLPNLLPRRSQVRTMVDLLRQTGWIRNEEAVLGLVGKWYLDLKRLGELGFVARKVEALLVANDWMKRYGSPGVNDLIAALQQENP